MNDATKGSPVGPAAGTSVAPSPQGQPPSTSALFIKVFPSIMLPMFLAVADQTIVATALPAIASGLGEIGRASWVVGSYLIANTIAAPAYGGPGDTVGRPGGVLFIIFVSPVILALEQVQHMDARTLPMAFGLLAFGIFSLVALLWQEQRNPAPLLPPRLFRNPSVGRSDGLAACHGAALVSLITFLPIYLRAVRGASPAETGLLLLPLTFGIGLGSLITGQLVSRTGRTAIYPTYGLAAATAGLVFLALGLSRLSLGPMPWGFFFIALCMGSVMAVVQITVQTEAGPRMLGTGAAMVQFSRSVGAAFGTATVAAILFSILAVTDRDTASLFGAIIDQRPQAIAALPAARQALVQSEIADAFRSAFLTIALFTTAGTWLAWSMPLRRL